ncbi:MAG TPA: glycosyltransferase family 2 protein [Thermoplasmata archaeon]|nr:glycosyltransferase family 2 protein [Thermoplasmata archaeon]
MRINACPAPPSSSVAGGRAPEPGPAVRSGEERSPPVHASGRFEDYSLARYHEAIRRLAAIRLAFVVALVVMVVGGGLLFVGVRVPSTSVGKDLQWLTIAWLLPVPLLVLASAVYLGWFSVERFTIRPAVRPTVGPRPVVLFQITSTGVNVETVLNTARSALYWTRRHPAMGYDPRVCLVVEGWGYGPNRERIDVLRPEGVEIVVVPVEYRTARGTTRKGRALQYATERRRELGLPLDRLWIYHHDDETAIGEDTVLGIDEFVRQHRDRPAVGCGMILYSQHAEDFRPSQIQEFARTKDDIRTIFTITSRHNMFSGFHGSHYIARGDLEDATGWDVGPDMNSEDLIFETRVRAEHGPVFHLLKGFAHEQAAFSVRDQLKQRRRWFQGWWRAVLRQPFPLLRRVVMSYGMVVWMAALFSVTAMVSSWVFGFTSIFPLTGFLTGFVWCTMIAGYYQGYVVHRPYLPKRRVPMVRVIANGIVGALADSIGPWYGTFTRRPRTFQVIVKDRQPAGRGSPSSVPTATPAG